jgi:hypothetical protein
MANGPHELGPASRDAIAGDPLHDEELLEGFIACLAPRASPGLDASRDQLALLERFAGTTYWDERETLMGAYERHILEVRRYCEPKRLVDWSPGMSWDPICTALGLPIPQEEFPWRNRREQWDLSW